MSVDYISREAAIRAFSSEYPDAHYPGWYAAILMDMPASDVEEIVHARWVDVYNDFTVAHCSNCGAAFDVADEGKGTAAGWARFKNRYKGCPCCRALMDGGEA